MDVLGNRSSHFRFDSRNETMTTVVVSAFLVCLSSSVLSLWNRTNDPTHPGRSFVFSSFPLLSFCLLFFCPVCNGRTETQNPSHPLEQILLAVKDQNRGIPIDRRSLTDFLTSYMPFPEAESFVASQAGKWERDGLSCPVLHPQHPDNCTWNAVRVFQSVFRKILPLYAALTLVPVLPRLVSPFLRLKRSAAAAVEDPSILSSSASSSSNLQRKSGDRGTHPSGTVAFPPLHPKTVREGREGRGAESSDTVEEEGRMMEEEEDDFFGLPVSPSGSTPQLRTISAPPPPGARPTEVFRFRDALREVGFRILRAGVSMVRSCVFLSLFTAGYQYTVCGGRKTMPRDYKFLYYFSGLTASVSLFLERKTRRAELAMYTLPRALDSLILMLQDRNLVFRIPGGNVILFALSLGGLM